MLPPSADSIRPAPAAEGQSAVPLSTLRGGDRGRLHVANLCCDECELLNAMGLTEQCEIRVCQVGEPCIVQVNATRLGISRKLARNILVTVSNGLTT